MSSVGSPEESASLHSFDSSVLYDDESSATFDSRGLEGSSTDDAVEMAMKDQSNHHSRPQWQFSDGVRAIELVGAKCCRTSRGFQKEATFPCQPVARISSSSYEELKSRCSGSDVLDNMSSHSQTQISPLSRRNGPLERFTLMIGENVLHFKVVDAPAEECFNEPQSTSDACKCSLCGIMLPSRSAWEMHVAEIHCAAKVYQCDTCNAYFNSKPSLVSHMRSHPAIRPYKCTLCTKGFLRSSALALHMKAHVMGRRHFCQLCGKCFKSLNSLSEHENACEAAMNGYFLVSGRPFRWACSYCNKMFHHRRDRNIHERVHTGEKPYTCGYCGRGFKQSQTLTIHIRTHTGEKPYYCAICELEFRDSSALRKHEYRHATFPSSEDEVGVGNDEHSWDGSLIS